MITPMVEGGHWVGDGVDTGGTGVGDVTAGEGLETQPETATATATVMKAAANTFFIFMFVLLMAGVRGSGRQSMLIRHIYGFKFCSPLKKAKFIKHYWLPRVTRTSLMRTVGTTKAPILRSSLPMPLILFSISKALPLIMSDLMGFVFS